MTGTLSCDAEEKSTARRVWGEVREQCCLAGPIMIMYLLDCGIDTVSTVFVGHLGPFALAAFTLGTVFATMVCYTVQVVHIIAGLI
jgi:Na+-driven multidrug efflux pump